MTLITCNYHGCETQHQAKSVYNKPVNLQLVETFEIKAQSKIVFQFQTNAPLEWNFINDAIRNMEYNRIIDLINSKSYDVMHSELN